MNHNSKYYTISDALIHPSTPLTHTSVVSKPVKVIVIVNLVLGEVLSFKVASASFHIMCIDELDCFGSFLFSP